MSTVAPTIMTVTGPVPAHELGTVLPHEHLFANTLREYRSDGLLDDEALMIRELSRFRATGGGAIVDVTSVELGRNPQALRRVSLATGVPIVMGCGHYRQPYLDESRIDRMGVDALAREIVDEIMNGVGDSGVRPGVIGETGCDAAWVSSAEERCLRAAARAQLETGLAITLHAARWKVGGDILAILDHEGVPRTKVIVGHLDTVRDSAFHAELAASGCFVEFDGFSTDNEFELERQVDAVMMLAEAGYERSILISHDLFRTSHFPEYGGFGFSFVGSVVAERLLRAGLSAQQLSAVMADNPQRALAIPAD